MKLKPCPFCGSNDITTERDCLTGTFFVVRCRGCVTAVWMYYTSEAETVEAWNRRVTDGKSD